MSAEVNPEARYCPKCGADWQAGEIPQEHLKYYADGSTHYSRLVGVYDLYRDMTVRWRCPDCGEEFAR
jgi:predicted RNA-binding Zn-ribbon protein involved in translation (DUF1610 family)